MPLLKIHSGQLGIDPETVERRLKAFNQKAAKWGDAIVLLDEFDTFGRARGNDFTQNAIVAVFLRTQEYQNNTTFYTTNLVEDMDDAILSRMSAVLRYSKPRVEEGPALWRSLRKQFLPTLDDKVIDEMVELPNPTRTGGYPTLVVTSR